MHDIQQILGNTEHAYMRQSYGEAAWREVARFLTRQGYSPADAAEIMNSKHMRWADDLHGNGNGNRCNSAAFKRYYAKLNGNLRTV